MAPKKNKAKAEAAPAESAAEVEPTPQPDPKPKAEEPSSKKKSKSKTKPKADAEPKQSTMPEVSKDKLESWMNKNIEMMKSKATRDHLKDSSIGRPGIALIELQNKTWDEMEVSREHGRYVLDNIEAKFPDNAEELMALRKTFVAAAKATYMQAVKDREPGTLDKESKMTRDTALEFFDICNMQLDEDATKERLKKFCMVEGKLPSPVVKEMHSEFFKLLGFEGEHGMKMLHEFLNANTEDVQVMSAGHRWQKKTNDVCEHILAMARKDGAVLTCDESLKMKVFQIEAQESLMTFSNEQKQSLLDKNGRRVQIFRELPLENRVKYLQNMSDEEKIDLMRSELLLLSVMQAQQKENQAKKLARSNGKFKPGTEFRTTDVVKTIDANVAAIAKNTLGRVLEVDQDGDLRVWIPTKDRPFYHISQRDIPKLKLIRESVHQFFEGQAVHAAFGNGPVTVHVTLTSAETAMWSMLGQTADAKVKLKGDHLVLFDEDTRFEGYRNSNGVFEGRVAQEGDSNGHFALKQV